MTSQPADETAVDPLDERPHAVAVLAAIRAQMAGSSCDAYEYDQIPGHEGDNEADDEDLPNGYAVISLSRMFTEAARWDGSADDIAWRLSTRVVGRTIDEARWVALRVSRALNEKALPVPGLMTTAVEFESATDIEPDDGWWSGLITWIYTSDR